MAFSLSGDAQATANESIGTVVRLSILGGVIGALFTALGTVITEFTNVSTGNLVLDGVISGALVLLVGFGIVFGIVSLATGRKN